MEPFDPSFIKSFILINQFLQKHQFRYCLIGGIAAGFWGEPRYTRDMDFTVSTHEASFKPIISALEKEKFKVVKKGDSQIQVTGFEKLNFIADFILSEMDYQDWVIQRAQNVAVFNVTAPICSPEDLIILKLIANRRQDLLDIENVLKARMLQLDKEYLHKWFKVWELDERFVQEFGKDFPSFLK